MSAVQPNAPIVERAKQREASPTHGSSMPQNVKAYPLPKPRELPTPEFYPTERTSTASFKAPMTAAAIAAKKKLEVPPPPPPGTLSTAMNYISTPVKYISSMFSAPPPPEPPVKAKEKIFKFDLERQEKLERQSSPKVSPSLRKVQNIVVQEALPVVKASSNVQVDKSQGSAWRRLNMMENSGNVPLTASSSKFRAQSPKRMPSTPQPAIDSSPTNLSQLKIASSAAQNSFKVVSKLVKQEEPEKKKKKEVRNARNPRHIKDVKDAPVLTNHVRSNNKFNSPRSPTPTRFTSQAPAKEEPPAVLYPTVLPPRIPPATYTIRSANPPETEEPNEAQELAVDGDAESTPQLLAPVSTDHPDLVSSEGSKRTEGQLPGGNLNLGPDIRLEETACWPDGKDVKVTRLDQLPNGRLGRVEAKSSLKGLFNDATLMTGGLESISKNKGGLPSQCEHLDVLLCSSSNRYHSADSTGYSYGKAAQRSDIIVTPQPTSVRKDRAASPKRKLASPDFVRSETREPRSKITSQNPTKSSPYTNAIKNETTHTEVSELPKNTNRFSTIGKENAIRDTADKINTSKKSGSQISRKPSPLKVDDKYKGVIEEKIGPINRPGSPTSSYRQTIKYNRSHSSVSSERNRPNVIKKLVSKGKEKSGEKSPASDATKAAMTAAAVVAAGAVVSSVSSAVTSSSEKNYVVSQKPASVMDSAVPHGVTQPPRSPPQSWKLDKQGLFATGTPKQETPKAKNDSLPQPVGDSLASQEKKGLSPSAFKDFLRKKMSPTEKETNDKPIVKDTNYAESKEGKDGDEFNCVENYCSDPPKYARATTMMGELP